MAKRYGIAEGTKLAEPIFEFFLKSDALHDPLVNDDHIRVLGWASAGEIAQMKALTHKVNARAEAAVRARPASTSSTTSSSSATRPTTRAGRSCSATNSRRTAAGCGTRRPARSSTRTASAAISAIVIEHYREVARRIGAPL